MAAHQSIIPASAGQSHNIPALGDAEQEASAIRENELFLLTEKYRWMLPLAESPSGSLKQPSLFFNMFASNDGVEFACAPVDWQDNSLDRQVIAMVLLSRPGYMSNEELATRLDRSRIICCPYAEKTWVKAVATNNHCKKFVSKVRKWVKRPGKNSKSIPLEHFV